MSDYWCALRRRPGAWSLERESNMLRHLRKRPHAVARVAAIVLLVAALAAQGVVATTFMSVEPIPGGQVVGGPTLALIESAGYENLELWSNLLLNRVRDRPEHDRRAQRRWRHQHRQRRQYECPRRRGRVRGDHASLICVHHSGFRARSGERGGCRCARQRPGLRAESGRDRAFQPGQLQGVCVCARLCGRDVRRIGRAWAPRRSSNTLAPLTPHSSAVNSRASRRSPFRARP